MKYYATLLLCLVLTACTNDLAEFPDGGLGQRIPAKLGLVSPTAINIADDGKAYMDYEVTELRMMGYASNTGRLVFNTRVTPTSDGSNTSTGANKDIVWNAQAEVLTGDFTVVFIANESVDPALSAQLGANAKVASLADLRKLTLSRTALTWDGAIPMLGVYEKVKILGDNSLEVDGAPVPAPWKVVLKHVAVRVDFTLNLDKAQAEMWEDAASIDGGVYSIVVKNIPERQYLFPGKDNSTFARQEQRYYAKSGGPGYPNAAGLIEKDPVTEGYTITFPRLILPESYFTDKTNKNKALTLSTDVSRDGTTKTSISGTIGYNLDAPDYTLPRNTYLTANATMKVSDTELGMKLRVTEWEEAYQEDVTPGTYFFGFEFRGNYDLLDLTNGTQNLFVDITCTYPGGWTWACYDDNDDPVDWVGIYEIPGWGWYIEIGRHQSNPGDPIVYRTGYIHLMAGNLTKIIKFRQRSGTIT